MCVGHIISIDNLSFPVCFRFMLSLGAAVDEYGKMPEWDRSRMPFPF